MWRVAGRGADFVLSAAETTAAAGASSRQLRRGGMGAVMRVQMLAQSCVLLIRAKGGPLPIKKDSPMEDWPVVPKRECTLLLLLDLSLAAMFLLLSLTGLTGYHLTVLRVLRYV